MTKANLALQRLVSGKLDVPVTARLDAVFEGTRVSPWSTRLASQLQPPAHECGLSSSFRP